MVESKESFDEFRTRIMNKRSSGKKCRITNSIWGKTLYRSVDRNHPLKQVKEDDFAHIIRTINNYLVEDIVSGQAVSIPFIGTIYVEKVKLKTYIKGKRVTTQRRIDWYSTHKLWYNDEEAYKKGTIVKFTTSDLYQIRWFKNIFNNKAFLKLAPTRALKVKIKEQVQKDKDVYIYEKQ